MLFSNSRSADWSNGSTEHSCWDKWIHLWWTFRLVDPAKSEVRKSLSHWQQGIINVHKGPSRLRQQWQRKSLCAASKDCVTGSPQIASKDCAERAKFDPIIQTSSYHDVSYPYFVFKPSTQDRSIYNFGSLYFIERGPDPILFAWHTFTLIYLVISLDIIEKHGGRNWFLVGWCQEG